MTFWHFILSFLVSFGSAPCRRWLGSLEPNTLGRAQPKHSRWLSAGGRKYDDVTQVSKPAVSPTSSRQTVLCSGACGFGNPRDSRFGNLRYRIRHEFAPRSTKQSGSQRKGRRLSVETLAFRI